jgi:hypothetical protein
MTRRLKNLLVLLHLTTAFGWLTTTLVVVFLSETGYRSAAVEVDDRILADFSFMTVYTGLMLALLGPWGLPLWVKVKLVMAVGCALGGRAMFPGDLVPGLLMIGAILAMAWLGRTKPGSRNAGRVQPLTHPAWYLFALVTPVLDYLTDLPLQAIPVAAALSLRLRRRFVP